MKHISQTMTKMETKNLSNEKEENISIVERILLQTGNPKLAAVLALDLLLVGVDTVRKLLNKSQKQLKIITFLPDVDSGSVNDLSVNPKFRQTGNVI